MEGYKQELYSVVIRAFLVRYCATGIECLSLAIDIEMSK